MAVTRVSFVAGAVGQWRVEHVRTVVGQGLPAASALSRIEGSVFQNPIDAAWSLDGVRSNERYQEVMEKRKLAAIQEDLDRPASTCAALIPIRKLPEWWQMSQDERRSIFEQKSNHIAVGSEYLPAVARRLYHCRDLGCDFDFLTWFEFAPESRGAFDELLERLRSTEEWRYVDREVELRLTRNA
ncbi:MAG: chlorite dismutase family protein [Deltaproteobacteria bacterium]|nr:chlorite dismutase family protein [Deltaproteobacteria bacterium]